MQLNDKLEHFADTFYGVLTEPITTFAKLQRESRQDYSLVAEAVTVVLLVFMLDGLRLCLGSLPLLIVNALSSCFGGLILWLSLAAIPAVAATCFNIPYATVRFFLVTTGWSFLPWLFVAPLKLYGLALGQTFVCFSSFILFSWAAWLMYLAIKETYHLNDKQMLVLVIVIPQLLVIIMLLWVGQLICEALSFLLP